MLVLFFPNTISILDSNSNSSRPTIVVGPVSAKRSKIQIWENLGVNTEYLGMKEADIKFYIELMDGNTMPQDLRGGKTKLYNFEKPSSILSL